ncbi:MAG: Vgb family protein [Gemmatimonadales bacterium]
MLVTMLAALALPAPIPVLRPDSVTVPIKEWTVPWERTRPRDPAVAPDGKIFFVGQQGNYIARLDPATGEFKRYEIDPGTNPHNVIVDAKGFAWYAGNRNGMIGKLDPGTGAITRYRMPDSTLRDPHTMIFDQQGTIWFTMQGSNAVGRLNTTTGKIDFVRMTAPRSNPYGITLDKDGRPYFDLFGTNKIGTLDPKTMELREYVLPDSARPRRIAYTSDGYIWYGDYRRGMLGRLDPKTGAVKEWPNPGGRGSLAYAMTSDDAGRIWFVETGIQPNRLVGFDPRTESFFSLTTIPSGTPNSVRYMVFDPKTRLIWFGTDRGTIGRAEVPPARITT